jgi:isoamylase
MTDDTFFVIFNASELDLAWKLPGRAWARKWTIDLDSSDPRAGTAERPGRTRTAGSSIEVPSRTLLVLRRSG